MIGDLGASEWVELKASEADAFSRGKTDTFNISAVDVNDISHVHVQISAKGEQTARAALCLGLKPSSAQPIRQA